MLQFTNGVLYNNPRPRKLAVDILFRLGQGMITFGGMVHFRENNTFTN